VKADIVAALWEELGPRGIFERSDVEVRAKEGLSASTGCLAGVVPEAAIEVSENGLRLLVDIRHGHKTGGYLDQRENRAVLAALLVARPTAGANADAPIEVLNAFAYTGGFGLSACAASPRTRVLHLDESRQALDLAQANAELNGFSSRSEFVEGNAFQVLRKFRDQARHFDVVILDPPKFAHSQTQIEAACRGYKDLNLLAMKLLTQDGLLLTFSCSGVVGPDLFGRVVSDAAADARRRALILRRLQQSVDHPVDLAFPQGEYLKGLALHVL
jgi:23S rRNA (cytosine1962-C5)-methyltransferase